MKFKTAIVTFFIILVSILIGYRIGRYKNIKPITGQYQNLSEWQQLPIYMRENMAQEALSYINWKNISQDQARRVLTQVLDVSAVPHGDMAVPSQVVHSKRYLISQWQRSAVGSTVIIIGTDKDGALCIALGEQRGVLRHPQGYMETALPKEDLTGLQAKKASRINSNNSAPVPIDETIEDNAVREVYEEIGIKVKKEQLEFLNIDSKMDDSPVTIAVNYLVKLSSTPPLRTVDTEFAKDDLAKPMWVKISNIKKDKNNQYMTPLSTLPVESKTIEILNKALNKLKMNGI